jgi:hypothetical protein
VVDRLRAVIEVWKTDPSGSQAGLEQQIARHRRRARFVLRACLLLYVSLACFVGSSLALALDAFSGLRLWYAPTALAVTGVFSLLAASACLVVEVSLSMRSFDAEVDMELRRTHRTDVRVL